MAVKTKKPAKSAKTKKAKTTKAKTKTKVNEIPDVFKPGTKIIMSETGSGGVPPDIRHLDNIQIGYLSTSLKHMIAELDLLLTVRNAGAQDYADDISNYLSDRIADLQQYLTDNKVIF